jgi:hypothetical protein
MPHFFGKLTEQQSMLHRLKSSTKNTYRWSWNMSALQLLSRRQAIMCKAPQGNLHFPRSLGRPERFPQPGLSLGIRGTSTARSATIRYKKFRAGKIVSGPNSIKTVPDQTVDSLILEGSRSWDAELIHALFPEDVALKILQVPISRYGGDDFASRTPQFRRRARQGHHIGIFSRTQFPRRGIHQIHQIIHEWILHENTG